MFVTFVTILTLLEKLSVIDCLQQLPLKYMTMLNSINVNL